MRKCRHILVNVIWITSFQLSHIHACLMSLQQFHAHKSLSGKCRRNQDSFIRIQCDLPTCGVGFHFFPRILSPLFLCQQYFAQKQNTLTLPLMQCARN